MALRQAVSTDKAPEAIGPYSQGIRSGSLLFCSGQIPLDPSTGEIVKEDVEGQARRCLENLAAVCEAAGGSLADAVRCTVYLTDMGDFARVNEVYGSFFEGAEPPARVAIGVAALPEGRRRRDRRDRRALAGHGGARSDAAAARCRRSRWSPRSTRVAQALERVVHVHEARVERRHAEPDRVRPAEVGDHLRALDQRPADRPGLVVARG